jgi:geranylgeranyl diphosphate synthase type I
MVVHYEVFLLTNERYPEYVGTEMKEADSAIQEPLSSKNLTTGFEKIATPTQLSRMQERIQYINSVIEEFINQNQGDPKVLYEAANHLLIAGGKRIRSLLSLLACEAVGGDPEVIGQIALAEELLQTASLIHDDIIDSDELRRGVQAVHKKYGLQVAIIAGNLLIAQAIRLIGEYGTLRLITQVGRSGVKMCEGEIADILFAPEDSEPFSTDEYLITIELKTVAFLREAARTGAIIGNASEEQLDALTLYAEMIGFAFQIRDDILDVVASTKDIGKPVLSDLQKRRRNYLLIHALESASEDRRKQCLDELLAGNVEETLQLISDAGSVAFAEDLAQGFVIRAKDALKGQNFAEEDLLELLADYAIYRAK